MNIKRPNASNVLISSAGRRVGLLRCFQDAITSRGSTARVFTIDASITAPASFIAAGSCIVPRCTNPEFIEAVLEECRKRDILLLVPTIDTELPIYAAATARFAQNGVTVCISSQEAIQICCNKIATHRWLEENGFPTVRQTDLLTVASNPEGWPLPLIAKPFNGSASIGVQLIRTRRELEMLAETRENYIIQEVANGREFTVNTYVNREGVCVCTLPHLRMEVRAGEVSKGITKKDSRLMDLARRISSTLPGAYGPLNIQCFMDDAGTIKVIEMNARFGGGYPLAHHAGGRFTDWLLDELEGVCLVYRDNWTDDLAMLRYDEAIFVSGNDLRI